MNVPKLRFKEFSDEWRNSKLLEIADFLDNMRKPLVESDRRLMRGIYPYYGASGIIDYINDYIFDESLILLGEDGANIITRNSKLAFIATGKYWVNNHAHIIKEHSDKMNQIFLCEYLEKLDYSKYNTGSAQPKLNQEVCKNIVIIYPSKIEQEKIANFLTLLDKKIKLAEKKLELLKLYNKGIMNTVFSNNNLTSSDLQNLCTIKKGTQLSKKDFEITGKYDVLNGGIGASGKTNSYNSIPNTISISEGGNSCGFVNFNTLPFWSGGHCYTLEDVKINNKYLYYNLKYNQTNLMNLRVGSGLPNIQKSALSNFKCNIHNDKEQLYYSNFFDSIYKKLELLNSKHYNLSSLKKSLLQQMFI